MVNFRRPGHILRKVAASKCHHCCHVSVAMLPLLYVAIIVCKSCVCVCHCMQCCKMSPLWWCKMLMKLFNATATIRMLLSHTLLGQALGSPTL